MVWGFGDYVFPLWLFPVLVWVIIWKAIAMWRAARNNQMIWFVVVLVLNTLGILPMIYLIFFQRNKNYVSTRERIVKKMPALKKRAAERKAGKRRRKK